MIRWEEETAVDGGGVQTNNFRYRHFPAALFHESSAASLLCCVSLFVVGLCRRELWHAYFASNSANSTGT